MCAKKKQLAKADKRWQRHLCEIEATRREDAAILADGGSKWTATPTTGATATRILS